MWSPCYLTLLDWYKLERHGQWSSWLLSTEQGLCLQVGLSEALTITGTAPMDERTLIWVVLYTCCSALTQAVTVVAVWASLRGTLPLGEQLLHYGNLYLLHPHLLRGAVLCVAQPAHLNKWPCHLTVTADPGAVALPQRLTLAASLIPGSSSTSPLRRFGLRCLSPGLYRGVSLKVGILWTWGKKRVKQVTGTRKCSTRQKNSVLENKGLFT